MPDIASPTFPTAPTRGEAPFAFDAWFSPAKFALLLLVGIVAAFPDVIFGDQSLVARDFGLFSYPVAYYHRECFWRGEFPLWNPLHNCGIPFLAQLNTMTLYPLSLIYLLLPLNWSLNMFGFVHLFIAGMGMYFLCQRWTGNRFAASLAGLAFALNGLSLNFLMWPSHLATYGWMPWVIWSVEAAWQRGGRQLAWAALFGGLQMLSGGPETIFMTWLILLALWIGQWASRTHPRWPMSWRFFCIVLLVAGLAAAQILPFLDLVAHTQRGVNYAGKGWVTPAMGWANFFVPLFGCFLTRKGIYFQDMQYWTSSYYVAIGVTALALLAIWRVRKPRVWLLAAIALVGIGLAMGQNGFAFKALRAAIPAFGAMNHPVKFMLLPVFALPLLAGFGIVEVQRLASIDPTKARRFILAIGALVVVVIAGLVLLARVHPADQEVWAVTAQNGLGRVVLLIAVLGTVLLLFRVTRIRSQVLACLALLLLVWMDVLSHEPTQNPTAHRTAFQPNIVKFSPQPRHGNSRAFVSFAAIRQMLGGTSGNVEQDFVLFRQALFLDSNLLDDIPTIGGFYSLYLKNDLPVRSLLGTPHDKSRDPFADFVGISWETDPADIFKLVPRKTFLPMITAGQAPVFAGPDDTISALASPDFNPQQVVYLPLEARDAVTVSNHTDAHIVSSNLTAQHIDLDVESKEPSLVVAAQTFYHPWRAFVNGREVVIQRANYNFQAWQVPAGRSHVRLEYRDKAFQIGCILSLTSLAICLGIVWLAPRVARQRTTTAPAQS
ncbi:MAG: hypothetical protein JWR26_2569 [Pedosphaera sp.]|nr:hypothetical protein [Pedosphaera sp.]